MAAKTYKRGDRRPAGLWRSLEVIVITSVVFLTLAPVLAHAQSSEAGSSGASDQHAAAVNALGRRLSKHQEDISSASVKLSAGADGSYAKAINTAALSIASSFGATRAL